MLKKSEEKFFSPELEVTKIQYFGRICVTMFAVRPQGQRLPYPRTIA
jgi:hypothetical protein